MGERTQRRQPRYENCSKEIKTAESHLLQGDFGAARDSAGRGLETMRAIGDRQMEASSLNVLGQIALSESESERAGEFFEDALAVAREIGYPNREGRALLGLGMIARKTGDGDDAIAKQAHAKELFEQSGHEMKLARVELELARTRLDRGETETAQEHAESACDRFQRLDAAHWHARSQKLLGQVHARTGNTSQARENWTAALETFETVGAPQDTLQTLRYLYEQFDGEDRSGWCQHAQSALEGAPEPIKNQQQDWVARACESGEND